MQVEVQVGDKEGASLTFLRSSACSSLASCRGGEARESAILSLWLSNGLTGMGDGRWSRARGRSRACSTRAGASPSPRVVARRGSALGARFVRWPYAAGRVERDARWHPGGDAFASRAAASDVGGGGGYSRRQTRRRSPLTNMVAEVGGRGCCGQLGERRKRDA